MMSMFMRQISHHVISLFVIVALVAWSLHAFSQVPKTNRINPIFESIIDDIEPVDFPILLPKYLPEFSQQIYSNGSVSPQNDTYYVTLGIYPSCIGNTSIGCSYIFLTGQSEAYCNRNRKKCQISDDEKQYFEFVPLGRGITGLHRKLVSDCFPSECRFPGVIWEYEGNRYYVGTFDLIDYGSAEEANRAALVMARSAVLNNIPANGAAPEPFEAEIRQLEAEVLRE